MAQVVNESRLKQAVENNDFIKNGTASCAEGVKYDFRMGTRLLKAKFSVSVDMSQLSGEDKKHLYIEPGEMVFVLTEERLELPSDMMAVLSPKRKLSHQGILILGGFCIDPLYRGRLLVGLYNFSSTKFPLIPNKKLVAAVFYSLDRNETNNFQAPETSIEDFPDELVQVMQSYEHATIHGLKEIISETKRQLDDLRSEITSGREWQRRFQESLDRHDQQIDRLLKGLEEEKENRKVAEHTFREELRTVQREIYTMAAKLGAIIGGIAIIASITASYFLPKLFP